MNQPPNISVIVNITDHPVIEDLLAGLARQTMPLDSFELLIVDAEHSANVENILQSGGVLHDSRLQVRFLKAPKGGRASANNLGAKEALGNLLIFLADDMLPNAGFVEAHSSFHRDNPAAEIVGIGRVLFPEKLRAAHFPRWLEDSGTLFGHSFTAKPPHVPENYFFVGNSSIKKSFFYQAGGFDEEFPSDAWDDCEFALRAIHQGMCAKLVLEGTAIHEHTITLSDRYHKMYCAGKTAPILERKYSGPRAWEPVISYPWWRHRWAAIKAACNSLVKNRNQNIEAYYCHRMNEAFSRGYRG